MHGFRSSNISEGIKIIKLQNNQLENATCFQYLAEDGAMEVRTSHASNLELVLFFKAFHIHFDAQMAGDLTLIKIIFQK